MIQVGSYQSCGNRPLLNGTLCRVCSTTHGTASPGAKRDPFAAFPHMSDPPVFRTTLPQPTALEPLLARALFYKDRQAEASLRSGCGGFAEEGWLFLESGHVVRKMLDLMWSLAEDDSDERLQTIRRKAETDAAMLVGILKAIQ